MHDQVDGVAEAEQCRAVDGRGATDLRRSWRRFDVERRRVRGDGLSTEGFDELLQEELARRDRARGEAQWARAVSPPSPGNARSTQDDSPSQTRGACEKDTRSWFGKLVNIAHKWLSGEVVPDGTASARFHKLLTRLPAEHGSKSPGINSLLSRIMPTQRYRGV